jgi:hypothetical protein
MAFLDEQANQAQTNIKLAQKYGYDPKNFMTMLEKSNEQRRILAQDITKDARTDAQNTANIWRDVNSPAAASAALEHMRAKYGEQKAQEIDARLPHDAAGNVLWNEQAKMVVAPIVSEYTSTATKNTQLHNAASLEHQMRADEERARHDRAIEWKAAQDVALRREGLAQRSKVYEAAGFGKVVATTQKDQAALDKTANNYKIIDYQKGNEVASRVESALLDPAKGYEAVSAPNARVLVEQSKLMMDNYRARTGGKFQDQQVSRMNSLLGRAEKFIDTIGEGDKLLAKDVMLQMAREMKTMYADRNADLLKDELRVAEKTNLKGGNAALLTLKGDLNAAIDSGKAKKVVVDGKDYIAFGKNKEDIFEVPTMPERLKNMQLFGATE